MANIKDWLLEAEKFYNEKIEAIVVGKHDKSALKAAPQADENIVLSREDGLLKLDQEYSNSYGGADCYPMYAWTKSRVFFIAEYDGATGPSWAPRNPMNLEPCFSGNNMIFDVIERQSKSA